MKALHHERVYSILKKHATGIDAFEIIPIPDLARPLTHTKKALRAGLIPPLYGWTEKKTEHAYRYKGHREWARSIVVAAKYYYTDEDYPDCDGYLPNDHDASIPDTQGGTREKPRGRFRRPYGRIARFTWRNNYRYLTERLHTMVIKLGEELDVNIRHRTLSNYTSIPEKPLFAFSGLADFGKNCVLIHRTMGSYFAVGELFTDMHVDFSGRKTVQQETVRPPDFAICGSCRRCIDACPTGALSGDGNIDVNSCFQYLSENLLSLPQLYRSAWGNRLYGCSVCMDVCPHNSGLEPHAEKHRVGYVGTGEDLINLLALSDEQWQQRFKDNQLIIRDRLAIIKNALLCLGNYPCEQAFAFIEAYLNHASPIIRTCAAWALGSMGGRLSRNTLERRLAVEHNATVHEEIERVL
jgi:epoxyqueuosine reductase